MSKIKDFKVNMEVNLYSQIGEYKLQDPMTSETLARIEELEWVLDLLKKSENK